MHRRPHQDPPAPGGDAKKGASCSLALLQCLARTAVLVKILQIPGGNVMMSASYSLAP